MITIKNKYIIPFLAIVLLFVICNYPDNGIEKYKRLQDCPGYLIKDTLGLIDNYLYPADLDQLNAKKILALCFEGTKIDSSLEVLGKVTIQTYTIAYKGSEMHLDHFKSNDGKCHFNIGLYTLTSNIFNIKNGITIGMTKKDFLKKLNIKDADCEMFTVDLDDRSICYYRIYFRHDRLKCIVRDIPAM